MKTLKRVLLFTCIFAISITAHGGEEVDRLLSEYEKIETVTCQIRRIKEGGLGKIKFLSRVYWTNKDQIHAEGITPMKRRTIADGKRLCQYVEGDPKGFSRPVDELSEQMLISLRFVPGTAMDHLLRLKGKDETVLPPEDDAAKRIGIQTEKQYVVLTFDGKDRLAGIGFFKSKAAENPMAKYEYSDFEEALPDVWIPLTHTVVADQGGTKFSETVKVDRFMANKPVAESLFIANNFFDKGIDFVDDFAKIFPQQKGE